MPGARSSKIDIDEGEGLPMLDSALRGTYSTDDHILVYQGDGTDIGLEHPLPSGGDLSCIKVWHGRNENSSFPHQQQGVAPGKSTRRGSPYNLPHKLYRL